MRDCVDGLSAPLSDASQSASKSASTSANDSIRFPANSQNRTMSLR